MTGPDYIIIGAMKCGTTTLAAQLGAQDGLFMTTPKEPNYFSDDAVFARGPDWYANLFADAAPGDLKGEASTHYAKRPTYPQTIDRLAATGATPRIIYLIRNPLVRAVSHYIHEWTEGVVSEGLGAALVSHPEIVSYGCYAAQIAPWIDRFGSGNVMVANLETMTRDPQAVLDSVGAFLGREGLSWVPELRQVHVSAERSRPFPMKKLLIENAPATWLRRSLVPKRVRTRIREGRRMKTRPEFSAVDKARLIGVFAEDYAALKEMFPQRPDLDLSYPFLADGAAG